MSKVEVVVYPPQKKPKERQLLYPLSGGTKHTIPQGYPGGQERSPAMRLLKMSLHGMQILGGSGKVEVSMTDVAASLAMVSPIGGTNGAEGIEITYKKLSKQAYHFALAKYLDDRKSIEETLQYAWMATIDLALEKGWKVRAENAGQELFRKASRIAVGMHMDPQNWRLCPYCGGTGLNRKGACKNCLGTGKREMKHAELAREIGISQTNYTKVWVPRVDAI